MKIRMNLDSLNEAISRASTVKPMNGNQQSAYLFTINDGRLYIHSQDAHDYIRTEVPVLEIMNPEGSFVYPADRTEALQYLEGWIDIESGEDEGHSWIKYRTEGGATANRTTYDPKLYNSLEAALAEAATEYTYPTVLLREGIAATSRYLASQDDDEVPFKTIQIFDASNPEWEKGDGTMYAADGQRSCYFYSPVLKGKGLAVHDKHIPHLTSFLGKCQKNVKVKIGKSFNFLIDQVVDLDGIVRDGSVFGWTKHTKTHPKYKYYPPKFDKFILLTPKSLVLKNLRQIRSELKDAKKDKVRIIYSDKSLKFIGSVSNKEVVESVPVGVKPMPLEEGGESAPEFAANANVNFLIGLFESAKGNEVELRVASLDNKKALFRTVEKFWLNDSGKLVIAPEESRETCHECLVTYFSTSMD